MVDRELTADDKFIVLASDGVFEFLTNQMVADIIISIPDPIDACRAVVDAAYDLWLQYDVRADDITIILINILDVPSEISSSDVILDTTGQLARKNSSEHEFNSSSNAPPLHPSQKNLADIRPVRRALTRAKMKKIIMTPADMDDDDETRSRSTTHHTVISAPPPPPKSPFEMTAISRAIKLNFLFQYLKGDERVEVIEAMQPVFVKKGDWVITQGDPGDFYYIIDHGKFEVRVKDNTMEEDISGGNLVHVYDSGRDQHPGFGELALL